MAVALGAWISWGLRPGIDFTGGTLLEVAYEGGRPGIEEAAATVEEALGDLEVMVQPLGDDGLVFRLPPISEEDHQKLLGALKAAHEEADAVEEHRFESIGPLIGAELRRKTTYAVVGAILAIVLYITWTFRKVSHPVASWKYGVATVVALVHDVLVPIGLLAALGHYRGVEVGAWVVTALLTVLGFSVHDTIVVFDRIREHLARTGKEAFEDVVNRSMNETLGRSINTSLTVLIVLAATWALGGETIRDFVLTMFVGIAAGTYSSIFVGSPLLVTWYLHDRKAKR
jgi:preprotein translocase subunit SecF